MNSRSTQGRRRRAFIDLAVLVILAVLAFLAAAAFDAFEALHRWSRQHESWEVDEYFTAIAIATIALAVFSFRRWQDTAHEARRRSRAEEAVRKTHDELDAQVKERTGALWASEEKYRTLLENSGELIQSVDAEGRFVYVNPQWCQTLGYTSEETRQLRFTDVLRPDQVEHCQGVFSSLQKGNSVPYVETVFVSKDGREIFVEGTATPTFREGRFVHTQGFFHDVTERKRAEGSAERSEERFRVLFEYAPDAYYLNDLTGTFVDSNKAAEEMTGYKKEEMIGKNFLRLNLLPPMQIPRAAALLAKNVLGRPTGPDELTLNRKDGQQVTVEIRTFPIKIGNQALVLGIARDVTERKRTERELAASRAQFQGILDGASDAIISIDEKQRITLFNQQAERVFGYQAREVLGQPLTRLLPAQFQENHGGHVEKFVAEDATQRRMGQVLELSGRRKNGEEFPVEVTISKLPLKGMQVLTAIVRDITERKQAEQTLRLSEQKYRDLFESANDSILIFEPETETILAANARACETYGFGPDGLVGTSLKRLTKDVARGEQQLAELVERGTYRDFETVHFRKDGSEIEMLVNSSVITYEGKKAVLSINRDVTERKQAEEEIRRLNQDLEQRVVERTGELRESQKLFQVLATVSPVGIFRTNAEGHCTYVNQRWCEMAGLTPEEAQGEGWAQAIHPDDRERVSEEWYQAAKEGLWFRTECRFQRPDGVVTWVFTQALAEKTKDGEIIGYVGTITDITERKQVEKALRESEEQFRQAQKMEAVGRLAGGVAHDFNNLLMVMRGYGELLLNQLDANDPLRRNAEEIQKAAERATALTQQLLAFSRKQVLQPKVLDLNAVVTDVEKMLRRLIGEDIELTAVLDLALGRVKADPGQIEQIILNLAVNARDAMPQGGRLTLKTANVTLDQAYVRQHLDATPGPYVLLAVSDTGVGMDAETRSHIFEPFFTTKEAGKGTGLGLSTVYGIVKQSGGTIWVESAPGRGTTFEIYLPLVEEAAASGELHPALPAPTPGGTETSLVVEDEMSVRKLAAEFLGSNGYRVLEAQDGAEALQVCEEHRAPIHLLLTDVVMPGMSGRELAVRLVGARPEMKVIYVSGYTDDAIVQHGVREEGTVFLQKPFSLDTLARTVREALDSKRKK